MGIGVDLGDLGIATSAPVTPQEVPVAPARDFEALIPGEPLAQVLFQVWSGRDVVVVPSPPGAGKTTLLARLVAQLHARGTMNMTVITPTRRSAFDCVASPRRRRVFLKRKICAVCSYCTFCNTSPASSSGSKPGLGHHRRKYGNYTASVSQGNSDGDHHYSENHTQN